MILLERHDEVALVTLNRPEKRNAVNRPMSEVLRQTLIELERCKVVVITGSGSAFCSGVDLADRTVPSWPATLGIQGSQFWSDTIHAIRHHPAVFVAAVNGPAVGGGLSLVNSTELAIASTRAKFGAPEMSMGSFPALAGPSTIRAILPKHAARLIFTGELIDAETALRWGLVNEVVESTQLLDRAMDLAHRIATFDAATLALGKRAFTTIQSMTSWDHAAEYAVHTSTLSKIFSGGSHVT